MKIGTMEFLVIFLIVFFVLGPEKTVLYARKLGKLLRTLKVYINSITGDLRETVVEPLQEIQEPLKDIAAPLDDLTKTIQQPMNELNATVRGLDSPVTATAAKPVSPKADETKAENTDELEFAELEMAEPEADESPGDAASESVQVSEPEPEAHVDADIEDAGDVKKPESDEPPAAEIGLQETDFKT